MTYEAMVIERPYRGRLTREEAIADLRNCAGTQLDPQIVEKLIGVVSAKTPEDLS